MEAPDKIYIPNCIDTVSKAILTTTAASDDIEYIRKNLLLAWAKQKQYESTTIVSDNFWQEVIDKISTL